MKVLIADDDKTSRRILQMILGKLGYDVLTAENGCDALNILRQPDPPPLAILDWMMPEVSGLEVCRQIRAESREQYTYMMLLTSKTQKGDIIEGLEAGADDYVAKPFDTQELRVRLRSGVRIMELQSQLIAAREMFRDQAMHDLLTGLLNHNAILAAAERELSRARRQGRSVGLILGDLDHFKQINDHFGHPVGDVVLQEIARRLAATVRPYDSIGRYGGEEFLVVVPDCDLEMAAEMAERLRRSVSAAPVSAEHGAVSVAISLGVISSQDFPERAGVEELVSAVDRALYCAKKEGRNRVAMGMELATVSAAGE